MQALSSAFLPLAFEMTSYVYVGRDTNQIILDISQVLAYVCSSCVSQEEPVTLSSISSRSSPLIGDYDIIGFPHALC